ncbi:hypothetical protein [Helicobacter sp. 23-1045]
MKCRISVLFCEIKAEIVADSANEIKSAESGAKKIVIARQFERSENNEASVRSTDPHLQIYKLNFGLPRLAFASLAMTKF